MSGQGLSKRSQHGLSEPQIGDESSREKSRGLRKELVHGPKAAHGRSSLQPVTAWRKCSVTPPPQPLPDSEPEDKLFPGIMQHWPSFSLRGLLDPSETPCGPHILGLTALHLPSTI